MSYEPSEDGSFEEQQSFDIITEYSRLVLGISDCEVILRAMDVLHNEGWCLETPDEIRANEGEIKRILISEKINEDESKLLWFH